MTYQRYNIWFERQWLRQNLGIEITAAEERTLPNLADPRNVPRLEEIGDEAAARQVDEQHFATA